MPYTKVGPWANNAAPPISAANLDTIEQGIVDAELVTIKKAGVVIGSRRAVNLHEGLNVTLTVADDAGNDEVDVTINAAGGGGGGGGGLSAYNFDNTLRTLTASATWETVTTVNFTGDASRLFMVRLTARVHTATSNWDNIQYRLLLDGATTGVVGNNWSEHINANANTTRRWLHHMEWILDPAPSAAVHTLTVQSQDNGSGLDRGFEQTLLVVA